MAKSKKLLNCDFLNDSQFRSKISNRGKLLYLYMYINCDDSGFCGCADELIALFNISDLRTYKKDYPMHDYRLAIQELLDRGLVYKFIDSYENEIYLIRHYHMHNKLREDRVTESNYKKYLSYVTVKENVYHWKASFKDLKSTCDTNVRQLADKCQTNVGSIEENRSEVNRIEDKVNIHKDKEINNNIKNNEIDEDSKLF